MRRRPVEAIAVGCVLVLVGAWLIQRWGGLGIQGTTSAAQFAEAAVEQGNQVRLASLVDIVVFVPGYLIAILGAYEFALRAPGLRRRAAVFGRRLVVAGALADQVENVLLHVGLGSVDLDAPGARVDPSEAFMDAFLASYYVKNFLILFSLVALLALGMWALVERAPSH